MDTTKPGVLTRERIMGVLLQYFHSYQTPLTRGCHSYQARFLMH
jgi:hypothetical protein